MIRPIAAVAAMVFGLGVLQAAQADQLADIQQKGVLVCGTLGTSDPFSFTNPATRQVEGYEIDFCKALADDLGVKLEIKLVAAGARITELQQGRIDIIAGLLGWMPERAQQIDYSEIYFVSKSKIATRRSDSFKTVQDLAEKRVSATKGGTSEFSVHRVLPKATVLAYQDPPAAFLAMQQGKVDAICLGEVMLIKFKNQVETSQPIDILEPETLNEQWGLGVRKGEAAFLGKVNAKLEKMESSGEASAIFDKWMGPNTPYKMERTFKVGPIGQPL